MNSKLAFLILGYIQTIFAFNIQAHSSIFIFVQFVIVQKYYGAQGLQINQKNSVKSGFNIFQDQNILTQTSDVPDLFGYKKKDIQGFVNSAVKNFSDHIKQRQYQKFFNQTQNQTNLQPQQLEASTQQKQEKDAEIKQVDSNQQVKKSQIQESSIKKKIEKLQKSEQFIIPQLKIDDGQKEIKEEVITQKVQQQNEELPPGNPVDNMSGDERNSSGAYIVKDPITQQFKIQMDDDDDENFSEVPPIQTDYFKQQSPILRQIDKQKPIQNQQTNENQESSNQEADNQNINTDQQEKQTQEPAKEEKETQQEPVKEIDSNSQQQDDVSNEEPIENHQSQSKKKDKEYETRNKAKKVKLQKKKKTEKIQENETQNDSVDQLISSSYDKVFKNSFNFNSQEQPDENKQESNSEDPFDFMSQLQLSQVSENPQEINEILGNLSALQKGGIFKKDHVEKDLFGKRKNQQKPQNDLLENKQGSGSTDNQSPAVDNAKKDDGKQYVQNLTKSIQNYEVHYSNEKDKVGSNQSKGKNNNTYKFGIQLDGQGEPPVALFLSPKTYEDLFLNNNFIKHASNLPSYKDSIVDPKTFLKKLKDLVTKLELIDQYHNQTNGIKST